MRELFDAGCDNPAWDQSRATPSLCPSREPALHIITDQPTTSGIRWGWRDSHPECDCRWNPDANGAVEDGIPLTFRMEGSSPARLALLLS